MRLEALELRPWDKGSESPSRVSNCEAGRSSSTSTSDTEIGIAEGVVNEVVISGTEVILLFEEGNLCRRLFQLVLRFKLPLLPSFFPAELTASFSESPSFPAAAAAAAAAAGESGWNEN